ncbi:MAG: hypothetical protein ACLFR0_01650 [Alphaproteobacteria bacterium]
MVYVVGTIGFIGGFMAGLLLLNFLLRHKTQDELLNDRYIKWKYGLICWAVAAMGAYAGVQLYQEYLLLSQ